MPGAWDKRTETFSVESGTESCTGSLRGPAEEMAPLCLRHPPESQAALQYEGFAVLAQAEGSLAL